LEEDTATASSAEAESVKAVRCSSLPKVVALLCSALLLALLMLGVFSDEDRPATTWGQDQDIRATAVAISRLEYGLGGGLYHRVIEQTLLEHMAGGPDVGSVEASRRAHDPFYVNQALRAATSLDPSTFPKGSVQDGTYGFATDDEGMATFYALAFRLFGYSFAAIFNLYFVMLAISALLFAVCFWKNNGALAVLMLTLGALYALSTTSIWSDLMPSLSAYRARSTLGLIAFAHVICAIRARQSLRWPQFVLTLVQTGLLAFVITFRSTAEWMLIVVALVSIASLRRGPLVRLRMAARQLELSQPALVLMAVIGVAASRGPASLPRTVGV
jgi:hypothetical protein